MLQVQHFLSSYSKPQIFNGAIHNKVSFVEILVFPNKEDFRQSKVVYNFVRQAFLNKLESLAAIIKTCISFMGKLVNQERKLCNKNLRRVLFCAYPG